MDQKENEKMKIAIVIAYFGVLPEYFPLFLKSCKHNGVIDWILFTDDRSEYEYPRNVKRVFMTFEECQLQFQRYFDFKIALSVPQKICDFKCAYGAVFQEYLKDYDWWGHCDLDQVFGDLSRYITRDMLEVYDKLYSLGHLTLYRNTKENNRIFMSPIRGKERYKEVMSSSKCMGFDEWMPESINDIYILQGLAAVYDNKGADIDPYRMSFGLVKYDLNKGCYVRDEIKNSVFWWKNGRLFQVYIKNKKIYRCEYPYVHFQKRKMKDCRTAKSADGFFIIPNKFIDETDEKKLLLYCCLRGLINTQYCAVKFKSLRYRIKNCDWNFSDVFKKAR